MNRSDWLKRKRAEETVVSFSSFLPLEDFPQDYLESLNFSYEGGGECWLDLLPKVEFTEGELKEVVSYFSYINPKNFPPKEEINKINFQELRGGKSRPCTRGISVLERAEFKEQQKLERLSYRRKNGKGS